MMNEELGLAPLESYNPIQNATIVGVSAIIGSLIPLIPFLFLEINTATIFSLIISALTLFFVGAYKAKITVGNWIKSGVEMMMVGIVAALIGWIVGKLAGEYFGVSVY
jgi:predicted membrane protein (TIGR00267 family)